ncbi:MAG: class I SAM-dependent methyltransferase [Candidatus Scalinduaceae bacterium]
MIDQQLQNEIAHGKYLKEHGAGEVWNWETPAGKERWARRVKMLTSHIKPDMKVLEIGCGTGYFTNEIVKTKAEIVAIDISPDLLETAQKEITAENVTFKIENAYKLSFDDNTFDTVIGSSVLHHLKLEDALRELYRVLKPDGTIFFTEPNMLNPHIAIEKIIPIVRRRMGNSPDETAFFRWSLKGKLRKYGFENIHISPFDFLHPQTPKILIPTIKLIGDIAEHTPVISEIAGSLFIKAERN